MQETMPIVITITNYKQLAQQHRKKPASHITNQQYKLQKKRLQTAANAPATRTLYTRLSVYICTYTHPFVALHLCKYWYGRAGGQNYRAAASLVPCLLFARDKSASIVRCTFINTHTSRACV